MPVRKKKRSKEIFFIAFKSNEIIAFPWAILNAEYYLNERGCVEICLVKKKKTSRMFVLHCSAFGSLESDCSVTYV